MPKFNSSMMGSLRNTATKALEEKHPALHFKVDSIYFTDDFAEFTLKMQFRKPALEQVAIEKNLDVDRVVHGHELADYKPGTKKPYRIRNTRTGRTSPAGKALAEMVFMKRTPK